MFHQVEGLVIDKNITFGQLKGILDDFMKRFFGPIRRRASAPATSRLPGQAGSGRDVHRLQRQGLPRVQRHRMDQVLGCGMVHPNVLRYGGIDHEVNT